MNAYPQPQTLPTPPPASGLNWSKAIRLLMLRADLTPKTLSAKTGWSPQYISEARHGKANILPRLSAWSEALGIPASEIVKTAENLSENS